MNNKHSHKKILVNGCSQTQAIIPNLSKEDGCRFSWAELISHKTNCEVVNLATAGKDNTIILEEAQRYLLNYSDVNHVVVQLTAHDRMCLYREKHSFEFIPGEPETQFDRLAKDGVLGRYPTVYYKRELPATFKINYKDFGDWKEYETGDASMFYHRLSTALKLFNLYYYCAQNNIGLSVYSFHAFAEPDDLIDKTFEKIPSEIFLHDNICHGFSEHINTMFDFGDCGHFEKAAHDYIAETVINHMKNKTQVKTDLNGIKKLYLKKYIYDYND